MTREEAIRKLKKLKDEWVDFSGVAEALDMAIESLSTKPIELIQGDDKKWDTAQKSES